MRGVSVRDCTAPRLLVHAVPYNNDGEPAPSQLMFSHMSFERLTLTGRGLRDGGFENVEPIELAGFDAPGHELRDVTLDAVTVENETGTPRAHNDLTPWAQQGVLLLNTVLTVEQGRAFAHAKQGWETFTKAALEYAVQQSNAPLAAVLWGKPAQKYAPVFAAVQDRRPVLVLESSHPSPLSAYRGFFGSAPFGKINAFLQQHGEAAIDWLK